MGDPLIPMDFDVPRTFSGPGFRCEPLGPEHNERDHAAWMSSLDHIRATPGFEDWSWPTPMDLDANRADLVSHARDFEERTGFTYSILDGDDVIGCLYIYPSAAPEHDASVRSWVREDRAEMDAVVWAAVTGWIAADWPFLNPRYAPRA